MSKELIENLRSQMVEAFKTYALTPYENPRIRKNLWEDYVMARESFIKLDCEVRHRPYITLGATIIDCKDNYRPQ